MEKLVEYLEADRYEEAAALGGDVIEDLGQVASGSDPLLAAKAVAVAGQLQHPRSAAILEEAARSRQRVVRVAAAMAAPQLGEEAAAPILEYLLGSTDASVRKWAIRSSAGLGGEGIRKAIRRLGEKDPIDSLREQARTVLETLG